MEVDKGGLVTPTEAEVVGSPASPQASPTFAPTLANLVARLRTKYPDIEERILNVYLWGSRVYGLANAQSDFDFLVVTTHEDEPTTWNKATHDKNFPGFDDADVNVSLVSAKYWRRMLLEARHEAIQCYYLPPPFKLKEELKINFEVDEDVLRRTTMFAARQRFSIAQWNWETPADIYKRKKDVVHTLRYLLFAHQILLHDKIIDYSAANAYYHRIMAEPNVKSQVNFDYYRLEKERISKELKATTTLKYFHTRCETIIHAINHTLPLRENMKNYFSYPKTDPSTENDIGTEMGLMTIAVLRRHGLEELVRRYKIAVMRHPSFPNLVHLYADVWTPMPGSRVYRECAGLIVNEAANWSPICVPPPHIEELDSEAHEGFSQDIDWSDVMVYEKVDGTGVNLYYYADEWRLSTEFEVATPTMTLGFKREESQIELHELFWNIWNEWGYSLPQNKTISYHFQLASREHRYLVKYPRNQLFLVACFDTATGCELAPESIANSNGWTCVQHFPEIKRKADLLQSVFKLNPLQLKGFVVCDRLFQRRKIKSPEYVAATALTNYVGPLDLSTSEHLDEKQLHEVMRTGRYEELVHYFPHLATQSGEQPSDDGDTAPEIRQLCQQVEEAYASIRHLAADRVEFGRHANEYWFCATLIDIRNRQLDDAARRKEKGREEESRAVYISAREYFALMPTFFFEKFMRSRSRRLESLRKQRETHARRNRPPKPAATGASLDPKS